MRCNRIKMLRYWVRIFFSRNKSRDQICKLRESKIPFWRTGERSFSSKSIKIIENWKVKHLAKGKSCVDGQEVPGALLSKNAVLHGCSTVSYKWVGGWDWVGLPGGMKYRAAYVANIWKLKLQAKWNPLLTGRQEVTGASWWNLLGRSRRSHLRSRAFASLACVIQCTAIKPDAM